ncbi:MAG: hypothetical protein QOF30_1606 [Acidimicrobiaceae bacterium]|nr:hypothetical protein [Acidimicrobiaceae bacterium]
MVPDGDNQDEWPHRLTVFTPLSVVDVGLAERLMDRYLKVLRDRLTRDELQYAVGNKPPGMEVGTEPDGSHVLRISFGGTVTMTNWDGTPEDAMSVVNNFAATAADNVSADYWVTGGWRTQTSFTEQDPDQGA